VGGGREARAGSGGQVRLFLNGRQPSAAELGAGRPLSHRPVRSSGKSDRIGYRSPRKRRYRAKDSGKHKPRVRNARLPRRELRAGRRRATEAGGDARSGRRASAIAYDPLAIALRDEEHSDAGLHSHGGSLSCLRGGTSAPLPAALEEPRTRRYRCWLGGSRKERGRGGRSVCRHTAVGGARVARGAGRWCRGGAGLACWGMWPAASRKLLVALALVAICAIPAGCCRTSPSRGRSEGPGSATAGADSAPSPTGSPTARGGARLGAHSLLGGQPSPNGYLRRQPRRFWA
jgi:hypothetical protein